MTDNLELLIAAMPREAAHHYQCSLATARCQIRGRSVEAREEYPVAGAPTAMTIVASVASLLARPRLTPAA